MLIFLEKWKNACRESENDRKSVECSGEKTSEWKYITLGFVMVLHVYLSQKSNRSARGICNKSDIFWQIKIQVVLYVWVIQTQGLPILINEEWKKNIYVF